MAPYRLQLNGPCSLSPSDGDAYLQPLPPGREFSGYNPWWGPCTQGLLKVWVCLLCEVVRTQTHQDLSQCPWCSLHIHEKVEFIAEGLVQPEKWLVEAPGPSSRGEKRSMF